MAQKVYDFKVSNKAYTSPPMIELVQGDTNSNIFNIHLLDGKVPMNLYDVQVVTLTFLKADGNVVTGLAHVVDAANGIIYYNCGTNEIAYPGIVKCTIELYGENKSRMTTMQFSFTVRPQLSPDVDITSTTEYTVLQDLVGYVGDVVTSEDERNEGERVREVNEDTRILNENTRKQQEDARQSNEDARQSNEGVRQSNEDIRKTNENIRKTNENKRVTAEDLRKQSETARVTAEQARIEAETDRVTAETNRENSFNEAINDFVAETERVETIYPTRLTNVENDLAQHKLDYMPHRFQDIKNNKIYNFGFQLSAEGNPQIIYEEEVL